MAEIVLRKTYTSAASREALEAEAQLILLAATENPVTAANIAAGSFSFAIEDDEEHRRLIIRISGNERMLERVTRIARENRWRREHAEPAAVHFPATRTERAISGGPTSEVAHPARVNTVATPREIGALTSAAVRRGSVERMLANAARSVANVEGTAARARMSADPRRTPSYLAAAYGAAFAVLHQANADAVAGGGGGPAVAAAAMASSEAIIREARPDLTPAAVTTLARRVLTKIQRDETEPGPGERRQGGGRRTRRVHRRRATRKHGK